MTPSCTKKIVRAIREGNRDRTSQRPFPRESTSGRPSGQPTEGSRITGALGGYSASPVLAHGLLYFASEDGKISVVRPGREWQVLHVNKIGDPFFATPALSRGRIYARGNDALYCFSAP